MKRLSILLAAIFLLSCKPSHSQGKPDPEAVKLNNIAFHIGFDSVFTSTRDSTDNLLKKAIGILNKAIKIDSNYQFAYWNKFQFQTQLKQMDSALATGNQLIKHWPDNATFRFIIGERYEIKGDAVTSNSYYRVALSILNKQLSAISVTDKHYKSLIFEKATVLILLNQIGEAHRILKDVYDNETDESYKENLKTLMTFNRHELIYGKEATSTTITH
jgi:tetratricopeptide (TPR) repeat protein